MARRFPSCLILLTGFLLVLLLGLGVLELGLRSPKIKAVVEVVDQDGKPVEGAIVRMPVGGGALRFLAWLFQLETKILKPYVEAKTPANGVVKICGRRHMDVSFSIQKPGYYEARAFYYSPASFYTSNSNERIPVPTPWKTVRLQLKEIRNPIPMYVFATSPSGLETVLSWRFPVEKPDGPVGFDFFERDLVAPHGKGLIADVMLTREALPEKDSGSYLVMRFPNPLDGIAGPFDDMMHSKLVSDHEAPVAGYKSEQKIENWSRLNYLSEQASKVGAAFPIWGRRWYSLRLRSQADASGQLVACHYGKLVGHPNITSMLVPPYVCHLAQLCYYINPTPNSRNLEWDTKTNLFKGVDRLNVPEDP